MKFCADAAAVDVVAEKLPRVEVTDEELRVQLSNLRFVASPAEDVAMNSQSSREMAEFVTSPPLAKWRLATSPKVLEESNLVLLMETGVLLMGEAMWIPAVSSSPRTEERMKCWPARRWRPRKSA